jgi:hypothetical protein
MGVKRYRRWPSQILTDAHITPYIGDLMDTKAKEQRIKAEDRRLRRLFKDLPKDTKELYDGLIKRAAYMRATLEDYEQDLDDKGYVESFVQSKDLAPYERERPVARLYNTMNKNYQSIIKQLKDALPPTSTTDVSEEIMRFVVKK